MKQKMAILVSALALLASLTACAGDTNSTMQGTENTTTQQGRSAQRSQSGGNGGNGMSDTDSGNGTGSSRRAADARGGNNGTAGADLRLRTNNGDTTGNGTAGSANAANDVMYEHMLRNARVHDTDGDLRDNENSSFNTFTMR